MHAPVLSVLRHTATSLQIIADELKGDRKTDMLTRADLLTDARSSVSELIDAAKKVVHNGTDESLGRLIAALRQVEGA